MAFELLEKETRRCGGTSLRSVVTAGPYDSKTIRFSIALDLAEQAGIQNGAWIEVLNGVGADRGHIAVRASDAGYRINKINSKSLAVGFRLRAEALAAGVPPHSIRLAAAVRDGMVVIDIRPLLTPRIAAA